MQRNDEKGGGLVAHYHSESREMPEPSNIFPILLWQ